MTNLLPKQNKNIIRREYHMRLLAVALIMFSIVIFIASFLLVPSYFVTYLKSTSGKDQINVIENVVALHEKDDVNKILLETKQKLNIVSLEKASNLVEVIETVLDEKTGVISVNSFFFSEGVVGINGVADSRDDLVLFVDRLEKSTLFINVDLPISDLAASRDIEFSFKMNILEI